MGIADDVRNVRFSYDHDYPLSDLQGFYGLTFSLLGLLKSVSVHLQPSNQPNSYTREEKLYNHS